MAASQINIKKQLNYFPDVEHITELNSDLSLREKKCLKTQYHDGYITMYEFNKLCQSVSGPETSQNSYLKTGERILLKSFSANNKLQEFLKCMAFLTGIIMVKHGKHKLTFWRRFSSILTIIVIILCWPFLFLFTKENMRKRSKNLKLKIKALKAGFCREKSTGSGFVQKIRLVTNKPCSCHVCAKGVDRKSCYAIVTLTTVLHVFETDCDQALQRGFIKDAWRSVNTKVRLFYDNEEDEEEGKTEYLYGHRLLETDKEVDIKSDWCAVECVTHDMTLVRKLQQTLKNYKTLQGEIYEHYKDNTHVYQDSDRKDLVIIIGHPHGGPKKISVGKFKSKEVLKEVRTSQLWCSYQYDNITCCGSSGSPVFILGQALCGFGYWFGHPHNHSRCLKPYEKGGESSLGVEYKE